MSESASPPVKLSLWMHTRRWSAQNPVTAFVWLCFMAFLLFLAMPYLYYFWARFSYKPDVVAKGQLRDYDTGEPMPGVYVAVLVMPWGHAEWPTFDIGWGSSGGGPYYCSPASAVVKTDAEGRYYYRVSHQEITQGEYEGYYAGSFYYLRAYKYGYETVDARTGKPYDENPNGYSEYKQHNIAMRKFSFAPDAVARWKTYPNTQRDNDLGCSVSPDAKRIRGWVERADAIGQDAWRDWCTPEGTRHTDRSRGTFYYTLDRVEGLRGSRDSSDTYEKLARTYPFWTISDEQPVRDFTVEEQAAFCAYWLTWH